jgi:hypothetical protein
LHRYSSVVAGCLETIDVERGVGGSAHARVSMAYWHWDWDWDWDWGAGHGSYIYQDITNKHSEFILGVQTIYSGLGASEKVSSYCES